MPTPSLTLRQRIRDQADADPNFWLQALRWCPKALLELINSKACRGSSCASLRVITANVYSGAIMFNDSLTIDQCERLISQLSDTALPFQCAHGRYVVTDFSLQLPIDLATVADP